LITGLLILLGLATMIVVGGYLIVVYRMIRRPRRQTAGWALAHGWASTPAEVGLPFEEWTLDTMDGASLPIWDIPADPDGRAAEKTPVLVVLHGWGRSRIDSLGRVHELLRTPPGGTRRFRTLLPDLRGHGDASAGPTTLGALETGDIHRLVEHVDEHPVILLGHSLGAVIAINVATSGAPSVCSVIAIAPYDRISTPFDGYLRRRDYPGGPLARLLGLMVDLRGCRMPDTEVILRSCDTRTRFVAGGLDRTCPPGIVERLAAACPSGTFRVVPEAAHSNHHLVDPAGFRDVLVEALDEANTETGT